MKRRIGSQAKLGCFCTQNNVNVLTFCQAQASLKGGPKRMFNLLQLTISTPDITSLLSRLATIILLGLVLLGQCVSFFQR